MILQASLGSWLSVASTVFASAAAVATIAAVIYARKTVNESQAATKAMADQHREQIAELKASAAASHAASQKELLERRIAFDHDLAVQRLAQLQRISEALTELIHAVREERTHPSERIMGYPAGARGVIHPHTCALEAATDRGSHPQATVGLEGLVRLDHSADPLKGSQTVEPEAL